MFCVGLKSFYFLKEIFNAETKFELNNLKEIKFIFNKTRSGDIVVDDLSLIDKP